MTSFFNGWDLPIDHHARDQESIMDKCKACRKNDAKYVMRFDGTIPRFLPWTQTKSFTLADYRIGICDECKTRMQNDELDAMSVASN